MQIFGSAKNAHCFVSDVVVVLLSTSLVSHPKKQQLRIGPLFCNFMTWKRRVQFGLCLSTPVFIFSWLIAHMENLKPQLIHHNHRTAHFLEADNTYIIHSWAEVREVFFSRDAVLLFSVLSPSSLRVKIESNFHMDEERRRQVLQATKEEEED